MFLNLKLFSKSEIEVYGCDANGSFKEKKTDLERNANS
jgi:hypothetical protein